MQLVDDALTPARLPADRYTAQKKGTILMMQDDPHEETQTLVAASHADASDAYVYVCWCHKRLRGQIAGMLCIITITRPATYLHYQ